jgi:hypothetical protein
VGALPFCFTEVALAKAPLLCEVQSKNRFHLMVFPAGRTLSVIGHIHGLTSDVLNLGDLATDTTSSNEVYLQKAQQLLQPLKTTLQNFREDLQVLKKLLTKKQLQFIALEYSEEIKTLILTNAIQFSKLAKKNLQDRKLAEQALIDDAFLIYAGPTFYLLIKEPALLKSANVKIIAVEDGPLMQKSLEQYAQAEGHLVEFFSNKKTTPSLKQFMLDVNHQLIFNYQDIDESIEKQILKLVSEQILDPQLQASALAATRTLIETAQVMRQRDGISTSKIVASPGSGLLLIGKAHTNSILRNFYQQCLLDINN